jgi:dihydroflavonol-4-reductase
MKIRKIAVTGASGHVGNVLCRELKRQGFEVNALLYKDPNDLEKTGVDIIEGDILDQSSLQKLCENADVVFHLAARISISNKSRKEVFKTNVEGTKNLLDVCKKNNILKFIHFSSIHALDPFPLEQELNEERPYVEKITMAYEQSKLESEKLVFKAIENGLNAIVLNPTAIIGPHDHKPSFLGQALIKMYNNSLPMLVSGGYNWVDVRDVVQGAIASMDKGRIGYRYILSGHWVSLKGLSVTIGKIFNRRTPVFTGPDWLAQLGTPFINIYARLKQEEPLYTPETLKILKYSSRKISSVKAANDLQYTIRPFEETLKDTFEWYKEAGMIK